MSVPLPPKLNPNCQCICHYQSGMMHVVACCHAPVADLAQASVAAALESAALVMGERQALILREQVADLIRALITKPQHDALAAHVAAEVAKALADERDAANARADQARDAALVEAASMVLTIDADTFKKRYQAQFNRKRYDVDGVLRCQNRALNIQAEDARDAILALRDKPAPGVTPKIEVKFTWAKGDEEFWVHLKSPDGKSAGFNLGNPKGMIATALLRAIAGGGDE
jgi:hypothetical protein